jgi:hypothetical protein
MVKERGLAAMAVFGNIVTTWSYFGVNMLGIGLHSYGFMDEAFKPLVIFGSSQLLIMALACIPQRYWASFSQQTGSQGNPPSPDLPKGKPMSA